MTVESGLTRVPWDQEVIKHSTPWDPKHLEDRCSVFWTAVIFHTFLANSCFRRFVLNDFVTNQQLLKQFDCTRSILSRGLTTLLITVYRNLQGHNPLMDSFRSSKYKASANHWFSSCLEVPEVWALCAPVGNFICFFLPLLRVFMKLKQSSVWYD